LFLTPEIKHRDFMGQTPENQYGDSTSISIFIFMQYEFEDENRYERGPWEKDMDTDIDTNRDIDRNEEKK
jgi:hypothetical protein